MESMKKETRIALQAVLIALITLLLSHFLQLNRGYWSTLTAILVLGGSLGAGVQKGLTRAFMTVLGCVIGWALYHIVPYNLLSKLTVICLATFLTFYFFSKSYSLSIIFITLMVVFMFAALGAWQIQILEARIFETGLGVLVVCMVSYWFLPVKVSLDLPTATDHLLSKMEECLQHRSGDVTRDIRSLIEMYQRARYEAWFSRRRIKSWERILKVIERLADEQYHATSVSVLLSTKMRPENFEALLSPCLSPVLKRFDILLGRTLSEKECKEYSDPVPTLGYLIQHFGHYQGVCAHPVLLTGLHYYFERMEFSLDELISLKEKHCVRSSESK